jgi:hypothetical protein
MDGTHAIIDLSGKVNPPEPAKIEAGIKEVLGADATVELR